MERIQHREGCNEHLATIRPQRRASAEELKDWRWLRNRPRFFELASSEWWRGGREPKRDSQRGRCYAAEREAAPNIKAQTFRNVAEAARYVRDLMETKWFQRRFPYFEQCKVTYKPRSSWAWGQPIKVNSSNQVIAGKITLSSWAMGMYKPEGCRCEGGELVVLHELAHAVLPDSHLHDARWARTFLEFVGFRLGREAKAELQRCFRKHRVRHNPPRACLQAPYRQAAQPLPRPQRTPQERL